MRRSLTSCLPVKRRIQFFIFRLKHWKEIKKLKAVIDREFIYGTSDERPKGMIKAAEKREQEMTMKMNEAKEEIGEEKEKHEDVNGCGYCSGEGVVSFVYHPTLTDTGIQAPALYCPMCGRRIVEEEGEVKE